MDGEGNPRPSSRYWDTMDVIKADRQAAISQAMELLRSSDVASRFVAVSLFNAICNPVGTGEEPQAKEIIGGGF
jgi:hypothetical protein